MLVIQVTSQNDNTKIIEAIDGFYKIPGNNVYKLKVLLISKEAKDYKTKFGNGFNHKEDVLDIPKILKKISNIKDLNTLKNIADFLDSQILTERKKTESSEVETIMALIDFLSKNKNRILSQIEAIVDPENKIEKRFSEHSVFLKEQYQNLFCKYNQALREAIKNIDAVDASIISDYLKDESDLCLTRESDNPKLALASLVELFYAKLSLNGIVFDKQAIKFYLLDELIKCNVFPNK